MPIIADIQNCDYDNDNDYKDLNQINIRHRFNHASCVKLHKKVEKSVFLLKSFCYKYSQLLVSMRHVCSGFFTETDTAVFHGEYRCPNQNAFVFRIIFGMCMMTFQAQTRYNIMKSTFAGTFSDFVSAWYTSQQSVIVRRQQSSQKTQCYQVVFFFRT